MTIFHIISLPFRLHLRLVNALDSVVIFHLHEKLNDRQGNVRIPLVDILDGALDRIKTTCFGNLRANPMHLIEG